MATRNFVPRADNEGGIGRVDKHWLNGYINNIHAKAITTNSITVDAITINNSSDYDILFSIVDDKVCITYEEE